MALLTARPRELREDPLAEWLGWTVAPYGDGFTQDPVTVRWAIVPAPASLRPPTGLLWVPVRHVPHNGRSIVPECTSHPPGAGSVSPSSFPYAR
ncbi:glycosyltransferase family protein [Streptomyces celluloflavus]|uniref:hypothetical protein n=1 Tax=Streptomyces celluloflavus TaxID=58344 RepID=UPI0036CA0104